MCFHSGRLATNRCRLNDIGVCVLQENCGRTKKGDRNVLCAELSLFYPMCIPKFHLPTNCQTHIFKQPVKLNRYSRFGAACIQAIGCTRLSYQVDNLLR